MYGLWNSWYTDHGPICHGHSYGHSPIYVPMAHGYGPKHGIEVMVLIMALINGHGPMYHDNSYLYGNIPRYQCKKLQIIIVKIVAVLMVMVMHGRLETKCAAHNQRNDHGYMTKTHCILSETPYCIMVRVTVKCPGISPIFSP
jgi:hypothetical protein